MRALLSVYDKTGVVDFARELHELGVELVSSGGTASAIAAAGVPVIDVAEYTGYPAMLGHRVVTLHPKVHGGILAIRDDPEHQSDLAKHDIPTIDMVVGNLYPFDSDPSIELIDIGGPTLVRAAAKNFEFVTVLVDPADYGEVLSELRPSRFGDELGITWGLRRRLAAKAFAHTAAYDAAITNWFYKDEWDGGFPPRTFHLSGARAKPRLRYGENPHQVGALYIVDDQSWLANMVQHQGKAMSYLNVYDADAAWHLANELGVSATAVVIKHGNPCGVAIRSNITMAYQAARDCDPTSAFGGIVGVNQPVTAALANEITETFIEVVIAPSYDPAALEILAKKTNLRVLEASPPAAAQRHFRSIDGGHAVLVQEPDSFKSRAIDWKVVTERKPEVGESRDLKLAWGIVAATTSNAIVLVNNETAVGIGCGQQNRRDAGRIAAEKAAGRAQGGACASDAFFPFKDGLEAAIEAGATAVIQPGGSIRDEEVIAAANEAGIAMVFTGERHFKH